MSLALIRRALETRLKAMPSGLPTSWENVGYDPKIGEPWQTAILLPGEVVSPTQGAGSELVHESGLFQITLCYPTGTGMAVVLTQAELIRAWFPKGLSLTAGGLEVQISKRASVAPANRDAGWVLCPISIPYFSNHFV